MKCYVALRAYWYDKKSALFERAGVYMLVQRDTKRAYVGSSVNMKKRISAHFSAMDNGAHPVLLLNQDYFRYGSSQLVAVPLVSLLPGGSVKDLRELESSVIRDRLPAYNSMQVPKAPFSKLPKYKAPKSKKEPSVCKNLRYEGLTLSQLETKYGVGYQTLLARWKAGDRGEALVRPTDPTYGAKTFEYKGVTGTYTYWAGVLGVSVHRMKQRFAAYPVDKALKYITPPTKT